MRRALLIAILYLPGALLLAILGVPVWFVARGDVPWSARDLDCDGSVSMGEWFWGGLDFGWRPATGGPPGCMEVYSLKDGLPVVLRCPPEPVCPQEPECRPYAR